MHLIAASIPRLHHAVAGRADDIDIVALAAGQQVVPGSAVKHVGRGVAGDGVGQRIAGAVDGRRAGQAQFLDIGAEREADRGPYRVIALIRRLRARSPGEFTT